MPNYTEQQLADILGISVEENARRNAVAEARRVASEAERLTAWQREGRNTAARRRVVQTPRGSSYLADFESSPVVAYAVSVNQSRPVHADFDSSFAYAMFLNSKYKHHHKCATCLSVFRCGQAKCERTLCNLCSLRTELSSATFPTDTVARIDFNGSISGRWSNDYIVHEAPERAGQNQVFSVDYEAVERQVRNEAIATAIEEGIEI